MLTPPIAPLRRTLLPLLQNHFSAAIAAHELDFLEGRRVAVAVFELPFALQLGFEQGRLTLCWEDGSAEATMSGDAAALLAVGTGRYDGDALFFQRRLAMEGDTELALEVKSLLSRYPLMDLPAQLLTLGRSLKAQWPRLPRPSTGPLKRALQTLHTGVGTTD
ncbi:ubiquinone anaerobic biosynthesis accessory factor UbiT [Ferrimonas gelatinilytica]|uniref:SCP2 domain-containing protein n=1 Tax=Ferrimonas gelatinilytica TaxID=1255257 RepID=A0ABP9S2M3_9GAMM